MSNSKDAIDVLDALSGLRN